jgi:imidazolonepropionase-like amidohydrolase
MKKGLLLFLSLYFWMGGTVVAQETFPVNGVKDERSGAHAFTNATLYLDASTKISKGTLLIQDGKVVASGADIQIPAGYVVHDLDGKYIYPGLVEIWSNYGIPKPERGSGRSFSRAEQIQTSVKGPYNANEAIKADFEASSVFEVDEKEAANIRKMGFGAAQIFRADGLARGTSSLALLGKGTSNEMVYRDQVGAHYSFAKGSSGQNYPVSTMGFIALLRQTYLDAEWFQQFEHPPFTDKTLNAWIASQGLPQFFDVSDWVTVLRADKLGDEFGVQYIIKTDGDSYKRIDEIKATGATLIVPVSFPDPFDVSNPLENYKYSLADLKHWEMAAGNLAALEAAGVPFSITSADLKKGEDFWKNIRKAVTHGLSRETALRALTTVPAGLLNAPDLGHLKAGAVANFFVSSDDIFEEKATIYENWVAGAGYEVNPIPGKGIEGKFVLNLDGSSLEIELMGSKGKMKVDDSTSTDIQVKVDGQIVVLTLEEPARILTGWKNGKDLAGNWTNQDGDWLSWSAVFQEEVDDSEGEKEGKKKEGSEVSEVGQVIFPFGAYGTEELIQAEDILISNVTLWTMEDGDEVQEGMDVLIKGGKIEKIGKDLKAGKGVQLVDGTGLHLTPGIIDEHSHIGASSINDVATNSGMVRIGDVINPEDQEIYRALAGGVTAVQILHGSANPIGGQSALIKLRWGSSPEEMKIKDADGFIKFALGENVKRSSNPSSIRFPQTRMGVEQVYVDAFSSARDYLKEMKEYESLSPAEKAKTPAPRRDLAMETMGEILNKERFISCHSYVQSEINMLMKVAESFDFRVNTFTHILEGYKVADKMAAHGVGASTFSDWWNYKWEVRYAIAYNAAIMHREGVVTAINSDDAEMMRRLNQEAAKVVKYGGISEWDALKMVTINPAKLLHLDQRMGSVKEGKDADLVLWSAHPLSVYAMPVKTMVDGRVLYDRERDQQLKSSIAQERSRIMEKMKEAKKSGGRTAPGRPAYRHHFHCDDVVEIR